MSIICWPRSYIDCTSAMTVSLSLAITRAIGLGRSRRRPAWPVWAGAGRTRAGLRNRSGEGHGNTRGGEPEKRLSRHADLRPRTRRPEAAAAPRAGELWHRCDHGSADADAAVTADEGPSPSSRSWGNAAAAVGSGHALPLRRRDPRLRDPRYQPRPGGPARTHRPRQARCTRRCRSSTATTTTRGRCARSIRAATSPRPTSPSSVPAADDRHPAAQGRAASAASSGRSTCPRRCRGTGGRHARRSSRSTSSTA